MQPHTGEVNTASIACGVLGVGGNKGAVAVSFSLHRRRIAFVCSHFAAHQVRLRLHHASRFFMRQCVALPIVPSLRPCGRYDSEGWREQAGTCWNGRTSCWAAWHYGHISDLGNGAQCTSAMPIGYLVLLSQLLLCKSLLSITRSSEDCSGRLSPSSFTTEGFVLTFGMQHGYDNFHRAPVKALLLRAEHGGGQERQLCHHLAPPMLWQARRCAYRDRSQYHQQA